MRLATVRSAIRLQALLLLLGANGLTRALSAQVIDTAAQLKRIAGCYDTHMGRWSGLIPLAGAGLVAHTPPTRFQLDTAVVTFGGQSWFAVRPARLAVDSPSPATWELRGTHSIVVVWSTAFTGIRLELAVHQDSLIGYATSFHDAHVIGEQPADPPMAIIATRRACPPPRSGPSTETVPTP